MATKVVKKVVKKKKIETVEEVRLVHRFNPRGNHRLEKHSPTTEPVLGEWASSRGIARLNDIAATTDYYNGVLPTVFKIVEVKAREVND